jgi:hypothetical protein
MSVEETIELQIWRVLGRYDPDATDVRQTAHSINVALACLLEGKDFPKPHSPTETE